MDIVRPKPSSSPFTKAIIVVFILLLLGGFFYAVMSSTSTQYVAQHDELLISTVTKGELLVTVRGTGVLAAKDVRWLSTDVEGKIERILVKAGAYVKQGDVILHLSNPQLMQRLDESKWDLDELEAQTLALKVSLESQVLDQESQVITEKLNYERSLLTLNAQNTLLQQGINAVSQIDHEAIKIDVEQNKQRWELEIKRLAKQKENVAAQMLANKARLNRLRKNAERIQDQVKGLAVRASIDALVQAMPMELGQQVTQGTNLAKLAKKDAFIAELRIPEHQIQDISVGQLVSLDTRNSQISGVVSRINPSVENGVVQVDVEMTQNAPSEARPDLTVEGIIEVARIPNTLFVKRPMFAKTLAKASVFLLDEKQANARQQDVTFGKVSATYIEIKSGLIEGQVIIVSDVSAYERHAQIRIN